ncbi:MAG TPA: histidine kinase, partial [Chitinophagaceae bacterium]|nr:histidine kinase [Chitinophagaceae bacterium]
MRLQLLITLLLSSIVGAAQMALVFDAKPDVHVNRVGDKTKITTNGGFQHGQIIDVMIIGVVDEFRHREAIWDEQEANHGLAPMNYFISNDSVTIDFLPTKVNDADQHLPVFPHAEEIDYRNIEVMVTKNEVPLYDWRPVGALLPDKEYEVSFTAVGAEKSMPWPSLQVGKFKLAVGDKLKVHIRQKGTDKTLQYIYVERVKAVPEPISIHQFPNNTSVQDILNKEQAKPGLWLINGDELEIDPGYSLLLGFSRDPFQKKIIEYTYKDDPSGWRMLCTTDEVPSIAPTYLFIEKPGPGYKRELMLRYTHQKESILGIKISVKPRTTTTNWIKITAGIALAVLLFITGFYFNRKKNRQKLKRLNLKKEELENKLQLLSGQLNPHFLFNSLNSIQNLVNKEEAGKASSYLSEVAVFLRTVMDAGKKEYISLQEELHIAESYLKLEQKRKPFQYSIEYSCAVGATQVDFPP